MRVSEDGADVGGEGDESPMGWWCPRIPLWGVNELCWGLI